MVSTVAKRLGDDSPEGAALLGITHPNIVRVVEVRDRELVLERAECGSLHDLLTERRRLSAGMVTTIGVAIAGALGEIHRRGLVHGDVHPGNIVFDADMTPLLADFGAVRVTGTRGGGHGAAGFVAPEVERGSPADPRSDQWSLAATLRACLGPLIPTPLAVVLAVAVAAGPEDRFPSIDAFAAALTTAAAPEPLERCASSRRHTPPPVTRRFGPRPPLPLPTHQRPGPLAIAIAALIAVFAGAGLFRVPFSGGGPRASTPMATSPPASADDGSPQCTPVQSVPTVPGDRVVAGCDINAIQRGTELLVTLDGVAHRYRIGEPGDVVLLGDWDCDERDTPGIYRPSTGRVLLFGTWDATAEGIGPIATAELDAGKTPHVVHGPGCDTIGVAP